MREQLITAARRYSGMPYSPWQTRAVWDEATQTMRGQTDCLRFLFLVARDCSYLPADIDVNLVRPHSPGAAKLTPDEAMREVLKANLYQVPIEQMLPGDVLLFIYADINQDNVEVHHVGMLTSLSPYPNGSMIHCEDFENDGIGHVAEHRMDAVFRKRLVSVWRLKGVVEDSPGEDSDIEYSTGANAQGGDAQ